MIFEYFVFSTVYIQNLFSGVHPEGRFFASLSCHKIGLTPRHMARTSRMFS